MTNSKPPPHNRVKRPLCDMAWKSVHCSGLMYRNLRQVVLPLLR